eukprot:491920-Pelagomonas_calceolata.AAC.1
MHELWPSRPPTPYACDAQITVCWKLVHMRALRVSRPPPSPCICVHIVSILCPSCIHPPAQVPSFRLMWVTSTPAGRVAGSTAKLWFWELTSMRPAVIAVQLQGVRVRTGCECWRLQHSLPSFGLRANQSSRPFVQKRDKHVAKQR